MLLKAAKDARLGIIENMENTIKEPRQRTLSFSS